MLAAPASSLFFRAGSGAVTRSRDKIARLIPTTDSVPKPSRPAGSMPTIEQVRDGEWPEPAPMTDQTRTFSIWPTIVALILGVGWVIWVSQETDLVMGRGPGNERCQARKQGNTYPAEGSVPPR